MKIGLVSLGCPKNLVDSEVMAKSLFNADLTISPIEDADAIIVNTCGFIDSARNESIETLKTFAELKKKGIIKKLLVAGCLLQRYKEKLHVIIPEIDGFIGIDEIDKAARLLSKPDWNRPICNPVRVVGGLRPISTPNHYAYIKISDGCDHKCSFCSIPLMRGSFRSRPLQSLIAEAKGLIEIGVKEIILIAQDTTAYGIDLGYKDGLPKLLIALNKLNSLRWIRILYAYPNNISEYFLKTMAECERVVPYIDVPLQHVSAGILKSMRRGGSGKTFLKLIDKIRKHIQEIAIRSTFIVGYPGETDRDFSELLGFLKEARLDWVGAFPYSREEDTSSFKRGDTIPIKVKEERLAALMEIQKKIISKKNMELKGRLMPFLVEKKVKREYAGRIAIQAPDIDGITVVKGNELKIGNFYKIKVTKTRGYDIYGEIQV